MGLLDLTPDEWLEPYLRAAQNLGRNDGNPDAGYGLASRLPRPPLSLVGPDPMRGEPQSAPVPATRSAGLPDWVPAPPRLENLTSRALRMKDVPESDISLAAGNPERMKQLINQTFAPAPDATQPPSPGAAVAPIGDGRASLVAASRGIPLGGAFADEGVALFNAAAQPWIETGLSHAGTFAQRAAENERIIKAATGRYETDHPIGTTIGKTALGTAVLAPFGATTLGAKAFGMAGEALLPSALKGAATFGLLNGGDSALRGSDAKDIAWNALIGAAGGAALPLAAKAVEAAAPFLVPLRNVFSHKGNPGAAVEPTAAPPPLSPDGVVPVAKQADPATHHAADPAAPTPTPELSPPPHIASLPPPSPDGVFPVPRQADPTIHHPGDIAAPMPTPEVPPPQGLMPQLAGRYPNTAPRIWKTDPITRNGYWAKQYSEEELELKSWRALIQKDINAGNYTPWFDAAERRPVDPRFYPVTDNTSNIKPVRQATRTKYDAIARSAEATKRLDNAYQTGRLQEANARGWADLSQLEHEFIKELGPEEGRNRFKERIAEAFAAVTAGNNPDANLMMASFLNFYNVKGWKLPTAAWQIPHPAGARWAMPNVRMYQKMVTDGKGVTTANPKRFDIRNSILGHVGSSTPETIEDFTRLRIGNNSHGTINNLPWGEDGPPIVHLPGGDSGPPIDQQKMRLMDPSKSAPPPRTYGIFKDAVIDRATAHGVSPTYFGDMLYAGTIHRHLIKPLITHINEMLERTHRITGVSKAEVLRGFIRGTMPMYGIGGIIAGAHAFSKGDDENRS
jgi:hypothetical protein